MHYLYRITNTINGKIYIGAHSGALDDGYFGSGKLIKAAIAKYGRSNFSKEILSTHTTAASAFLAEAELVTKDFVALDTYYNLAPGGSGASIAKNRRAFVGPHSDITKSRMSAKAKGRKPTAAQLQKCVIIIGLEKTPKPSAHTRSTPQVVQIEKVFILIRRQN